MSVGHVFEDSERKTENVVLNYWKKKQFKTPCLKLFKTKLSLSHRFLDQNLRIRSQDPVFVAFMNIKLTIYAVLNY